jgi:pyridoxine/pyridoxamine 5'-phosphate oxidase
MVSDATQVLSGPDLSAFDEPPPDPIALFSAWLADATAAGVSETTAAALATVDAAGRPSSRMVRILHVTQSGWVFSSHSGSQKGRDAQATGVASAVLYWPETGQQVIFAGELRVTSPEVSDQLWAERDSSTYPMSVATVQSAPLLDEAELRARAARLVPEASTLARPATWVGYELIPSSVEFWHVGTERLHRRLRYDLCDGQWRTQALQP